MIPRSAITHRNKQVPWEDIANVEQDLIITRALTDIFADEFLASELAFRGGTALHKLYLAPQPRYSEDIDLVQINAQSAPPNSTYGSSTARLFLPRLAPQSEIRGRSAPRFAHI